MDSLKKYFLQFLKHREKEQVPNGFWVEVADYWSDIEGNETITNSHARKRFNRRYKKIKGSNFSNDIINDILLEFEKEDMNHYSNDEDKQLDEYSTKIDWSEKAKEQGVSGEYYDFLREHGIDEDDVVNVYFKQKASGTYFTVQTKYSDESLDEVEIREEFVKSLEEYRVPDYSAYFKTTKPPKEKICFINAFDAHLDKITFLDTTDESSTLDINIQKFEEAFDKILVHTEKEQPELIVFPIGNDFFHVNGAELSTKKGTPMKGSVHPNFRESFRKGLNLLRRCIDKMRHISNVELRFIRGNHDNDQIYYLMECLRLLYEDQKDVDVIDNIKSRQYKRYGKCLFGMAHGDKERNASQIPARMSTDKEGKRHWSEIDLAVFFLGDIHHEKKYKYMNSVDFGGVHVKFLRSMSQTDTWHWEKGFNGGLKTIYCFVYSKDGKEELEFKKNI